MAVASEQIRPVLAGTQRPRWSTPFTQRGNNQGLDDMRQRVRSGLLELVDVEAHESHRNIDAAGNGKNVNRKTDVVVVDFETIHQGTPHQVAEDLIEACRPGGRIGIACPAPGSFLAEVHERIAMYTNLDAAARRSRFAGTREALNRHFGASAIALGARDRSISISVSSAEHWLAEWRQSYAPLKRAFEQVDPEWRDQLTDELLKLVALHAIRGEDGLSIRCDYLEFVVHKGAVQ